MKTFFFKCILATIIVGATTTKNFSQRQNFDKSYTLSTCKGELPKQLSETVLERIKVDLDGDDADAKNLKINSKFYESYRYNQNKILLGGKILFGEEMSVYVNKIARNLLEKSGNEDLIPKLNFYVLKSDIVNAFCMPDGTIFITVGLLSQIENEAQLAFTLAHEISHYTEKHGLNDYRNGLDLKKEFRKSEMTYREAMKTLSDYSKDNELESDKEGFKMFAKAGYNTEEANKMLLVLQYSYLPFDEIKFDKTFFNSGKYQLPPYYFSKAKLEETIEDKSDEDDTYASHPNIETRVSQLKENKTRTGKIHYFPKEEFNYISTKARFENQYIHLIEKNFIRAVYESYLLKKQFPNNVYLDQCIAKALYGVSKINSTAGSVTRYENEIKEGNLSELFVLFNETMDDKELTILALKKLKELNDSAYDPFIEDLVFDLVKEMDFDYSDFIFEIVEDTTKKTKQNSFKILSDIEYEELTKVEKITYNEKKKTYLAQSDTNIEAINEEYYKLAFFDTPNDEKFEKLFKDIKEKDDIRYFSDLDYSTQYKLNKKREKLKHQFKKKEFDSLIIVTPSYEKYNKEEDIMVTESVESQEFLSETIENLAQESEVNFKSLNLNNIGSLTVSEVNNLFILNEWKEEMNESYEAKMVSMTQDRANTVFDEFGYDNILISGVYSVRTSLSILKSFSLPAVTAIAVPGFVPVAMFQSFQPAYVTVKYVRIIDKKGYVVFNKKLVTDDKPNYKQDEIYFQDVFNQIIIKK